MTRDVAFYRLIRVYTLFCLFILDRSMTHVFGSKLIPVVSYFAYTCLPNFTLTVMFSLSLRVTVNSRARRILTPGPSTRTCELCDGIGPPKFGAPKSPDTP
jgi:hypothetical protein